jgi:hypothetical protein
MSSLEYNTVLFTKFHSITGMLTVREQRLSDLLNDTRESIIQIRGAKVSRHSDPARIVAEHAMAIISKEEIAIAFEPAPREDVSPKRLYSFVRKQQSTVFMLVAGFEVSGLMHTLGGADPADIHGLLALQKERFLPVTQARVSFAADERYLIKRDAIVVNLHHIQYIAKPDS